MRPALAFVAVALNTLLAGALRRPAARTAVAPLTRAPKVATPLWVRHAVTEGGLTIDVGTAWTVMCAAAALAVVVATLAAGVAAGAIVVVTITAIPSMARRLVTRRRTDRRDAQLSDALERLASSVRAGSALGPAFVAMAAATPAPLGRELEVAAAEVEHGAGLAAALERWGDRPGSGAEVRLAAAALGLAADAGGEVARSVDRVAATLRERRELQAEVRALATQARASAGVLAVAPLAFTALVASVEPAAAAFLVTTPVGLLCLVGGFGLEAVGAAWMARILRNVA